MDAKIVLDRLVETCTTELFLRYDVAVESGARDGTPDRVAVIGFTGETLCGAFALAVTSNLFEHVATPRGADDWLAECANQLLGRIKNRLLGYGIEVRPAIPLVLHGAQIEPMMSVAAGVRADVYAFPFHGAGSGVCVWMAMMGAAQLDLAPSEDPDAVSAVEGEMVMF